MCCYKSLFYHFLDIATTISDILHKDLCLAQQTKPMTHRAFINERTAELIGKPLSAQLLPWRLQVILLCLSLMSMQQSTESEPPQEV
ncbi:hypothetical protein VZT92_003042 [Zoarces viviparus]|uniref:Uncharacterized protein n=1 Tax=Zoarces viviparus TaxID=48416 RepID=A0AAW1G154_ZOAVI